MKHLLWKAGAAAAVVTLGGLLAAAPAQAAVTPMLTCDQTWHYFDCTLYNAGISGTIRWFADGAPDPAFNDSVNWYRRCALPSTVTVTAVYTDPSGASVSRTKTTRCLLDPTP